MSLTIKFDTARYQHVMNRLVYELKADSVELLKEEMRLLLRDIVAFTPPTKSPKGDEVKMTARQRGNTAIENDMIRLAAPMDWRQIEMPALAKAVHGRKIDAINAILKNIRGAWKGRKVLQNVSEIQSSHLANRTRYGRIRGNKRQLAFANDWAKYTRTLKKRVGYTRAGWWQPAQALGLKLSAWVTRHKGYAPSGYYAPSPNNLAIVSINKSVKIPDYENRHVVPAMRRRARSLEKEVARLLSGGKSRRGSLAGTTTGQSLTP